MHVCSEKSAVKEIHVSIFLSSLDAFLLCFMIQTKFHPYSPMMDFFLKKVYCQRRFLTKWIYLVLFFLKKNQIWSKNPKISFRQFKLTLVFLKKTPKCLGSNKNVNVALFCVVVQSKPYLGHWKMYFTLILKFCFDYPIETKQENY